MQNTTTSCAVPDYTHCDYFLVWHFTCTSNKQTSNKDASFHVKGSKTVLSYQLWSPAYSIDLCAINAVASANSVYSVHICILIGVEKNCTLWFVRKLWGSKFKLHSSVNLVGRQAVCVNNVLPSVKHVYTTCLSTLLGLFGVCQSLYDEVPCLKHTKDEWN